MRPVRRDAEAYQARPWCAPTATGDLRLLVASIRSPEAFRDLLRLGVGAATVPVGMFERLTTHEGALAAERAFLADAG